MYVQMLEFALLTITFAFDLACGIYILFHAHECDQSTIYFIYGLAIYTGALADILELFYSVANLNVCSTGRLIAYAVMVFIYHGNHSSTLSCEVCRSPLVIVTMTLIVNLALRKKK